MASTRISFARVPRATGLARVTDQRQTRIKRGRAEIGMISGPHWRGQHDWSVSLTIVKEEHPGWRNVTFKLHHPSEAEARAWVEANIERVVTGNGWTLHEVK